MNSLTVILTVVFMCCCMVNAQQGVCTSAYGRQGQCQSIYNCQPLLALINKQDRTQQDMDILKRSHCGFDGSAPAVCCPSQNVPPPSTEAPCVTPEGKQGKCISLKSCPALTNLLTPPVSEEKIKYMQTSKCNGPDPYSVCCGPAPTFQSSQSVPRSRCANVITAGPPDPLSGCCGVDSSIGDKIYGGAPAKIDQYPWLALIEYKKDNVVRTLCGGALISGKYVLTAGHCVRGKILENGNPTKVRLGEYNTTNDGPDCVRVVANGTDCTEGAISIAIENTIPHPDYNPLNSQKRNDIALIRMREVAPYTAFIRPICLPTLDISLRSLPFNLTVAGWGAVSTRQFSSTIKLHVELPFVTQDQCQPAYTVPSLRVALWKGQVCAGGEIGKDTCNGDSGGPLMFENDRIYEAAGIVSFGPRKCGTENTPGVYTNVYEYNTWIRNNIAP